MSNVTNNIIQQLRTTEILKNQQQSVLIMLNFVHPLLRLHKLCYFNVPLLF